MSRNSRVLLAVVAVAILVVAIFVLPGDDNDNSKQTSTPATNTTSTSTQPTATTANVIVVQGGKPVGGVQRLSYDKGDTVDLIVQSDTADEIHIHGYDLMKDVDKGGSVHFKFKAKIDGKFEIELEGAKQQIASLEVQP